MLRKTLCNRSIRALLSGLALFVLAGCQAWSHNIPQNGPAPTDSLGNPQPGYVDNSAGFYVRHVVNPNYTYIDHKGETSITTPCTASVGEQAFCYIEGLELDLYYNGVTLQYNVPSTMCDYIEVSPYYYWTFQVGTGPGYVQVDTDKNGNTGYDPGNTGIASSPITTCPYDYTTITSAGGIQGPNCCIGTYTKETRSWNATTNSYTITSIQDGVPWGGKPSTCIGGPAVATQPKDAAGFPVPVITYVSGTGINGTYTVAAPISTMKATDIYVSNFFDPSLTGGTPPAPLIEPYYRFTCYDKAKETQSEILVFVRKWNTEDHTNDLFHQILKNPSLFNVTGSEPAPWTASPLNDYHSWLDFLNTYPEFGE